MNFKEYYNEVYQLAKKLGYSDYGIKCFAFDIQEAYIEGMTPQDCVDIHF